MHRKCTILVPFVNIFPKINNIKYIVLGTKTSDDFLSSGVVLLI